MAVLKSVGTSVDFVVESVEEDICQGGTSVLSFEEAAEVLAEKSFDDETTSRTLVEVSFAFGMCFARATRDGLGGVDLVIDGAHGKELVDELGDELLAGVWEFPDRAVVSLPVDRVEILGIPSVVLVEE